LPSLLSTG